jgi:hypothetical protein
MRKFVLPITVFCWAAILGSAARAEDETRAIVEKAVKAHGGAEKLAKMEKAALQSKGKGKVHQLGGIDITMEILAQDGKARQTIEGEVANTKFKQIVLFDGKKFQIFINGMEIKLGDKKTDEEIREKVYAEKVTRLVFLKDKGIKLAPLGEVKVKDRPALGVRVTSEGHRDVNLFFDKEKGLLIKTETRTIDLQSGEEKTEEKILADYKEIDGFLMPMRITVLQDGKEHVTLELEEAKIVDSVDEETFTKP